ncbi:hypothetical protein [Arthrobacter sp. GMC3]|uniref:hypothetical protein n=1 Tax=Arthrobacter sp. GMC3 TaxID=2058894 RepID=UPI000CE2EAF8|nr:hypothetical protein [Arthrobacter sp. GMC3]
MGPNNVLALRQQMSVRASVYAFPMIIKAILETIETGAVEETTVDCADYTAGFAQLQRTVPKGMRLVSVRPER